MRSEAKAVGSRIQAPALASAAGPGAFHRETGFSLVEFLVATFVLLTISAGTFGILADVQRAASFQTEVQEVLDNARVALDATERYIRGAANDPRCTGFSGIAITGATEVQLRSDVTGSAGAGNPDKGDPDGDVQDAGEDVVIRYNSSSRSLEVVSGGGPAQPVASSISAFAMQYFDADGTPTSSGSQARRVRVSVSAVSTLPDPRTGQAFGISLSRDMNIRSRAW